MKQAAEKWRRSILLTVNLILWLLALVLSINSVITLAGRNIEYNAQLGGAGLLALSAILYLVSIRYFVLGLGITLLLCTFNVLQLRPDLHETRYYLLFFATPWVDDLALLLTIIYLVVNFKTLRLLIVGFINSEQ